MKFKKFVVGIVASALLVTSMATTVLAAKSPTTEDVTPVVTQKPAQDQSSSSKKSSDVIDVDALASNITGEVIKYDNVDIDPFSPAILKKLADDTIKQAKAQGAKYLLKAVDVEDSASSEGKGSLYKNTITVRFRSSAFKAGMKITAYHLPDGSSTWEKIKPDSVNNGECIVTFTSLSPVVFATEGKSDKTGETAPILPIAAAICLAGVVFFTAKTKYAK